MQLAALIKTYIRMLTGFWWMLKIINRSYLVKYFVSKFILAFYYFLFLCLFRKNISWRENVRNTINKIKWQVILGQIPRVEIHTCILFIFFIFLGGGFQEKYILTWNRFLNYKQNEMLPSPSYWHKKYKRSMLNYPFKNDVSITKKQMLV